MRASSARGAQRGRSPQEVGSDNLRCWEVWGGGIDTPFRKNFRRLVLGCVESDFASKYAEIAAFFYIYNICTLLDRSGGVCFFFVNVHLLFPQRFLFVII